MLRPMPREGRGATDGPRLVLAAAVALTGLVFLLQGLGVPLGGGFMIGDRTWAVIGLALIAGGAVLAWRELKARSWRG